MRFYNNRPIRLIELFAGIGSQAKALKNIGVEFEHWRVCEFDKHAINSYNAVHGTDFTTSDITQITANDLNITDTDHFTYLLTYSFPCQDLLLNTIGQQKTNRLWQRWQTRVTFVQDGGSKVVATHSILRNRCQNQCLFGQNRMFCNISNGSMFPIALFMVT